jgi:hypothetical protein
MEVNIDEKFLFIHNEIIHKVQIILRRHYDIEDIFNMFDMYPSCIAYDGKTTYMNEASYAAYKYMVNLVDRDKASHSGYDNRILKYYNYGFSIALDKKQLSVEHVRQIESSSKMFKISGCMFEPLERTCVNDDAEEIRYVPINVFRLAKNIDISEVNKQNVTDTIVMNEKPMYECYDELDASMIGLYNYMTTEGIKYCYLMGEVKDEEELFGVINIDDLEFLGNKRDQNKYNWYNTKSISVSVV